MKIPFDQVRVPPPKRNKQPSWRTQLTIFYSRNFFAFVGVTPEIQKLEPFQTPLLCVSPTAEGLTILLPALIDLIAHVCRASVVGVVSWLSFIAAILYL